MKQELLERVRNEVAAGVAMLDRTEPNWYNRINLATLVLSNSDHCIMGQLFGVNDWPAVFATGPDDLGVYTAKWCYEECVLSDRYYDTAEPMWREAIVARRNKESA